MKTRITQNIDGYDIIIGIGDAQIDPVKTAPIVTDILKDTAEYKAFEDKKRELAPLAAQAAEAKKSARTAKTISEKNLLVKEYQAALEKSKVIQSELGELFKPLQEKQKELTLKHAVYFQPKEGEEIITPEKAVEIEGAMIAATEKNMWVDKNLNEICDYRAQTAWVKKSGKWSSREIIALGDAPKSGEILQNNLSESQQGEIKEQLEAERISALSPDEKLAEKTAIIQTLARQAADMKTMLEIQGDSQALKKSQDWYNAEVEKVEVKYS